MISVPELLLSLVDIDAKARGISRAEFFRRAASVYLTFEPMKIEVAKKCKHSDWAAKTGFGDSKTCGNCGVAWDWREGRWVS